MYLQERAGRYPLPRATLDRRPDRPVSVAAHTCPPSSIFIAGMALCVAGALAAVFVKSRVPALPGERQK